MNKRTNVPHNLLWARILFVILSGIILSEFCQVCFASDLDGSVFELPQVRKRVKIAHNGTPEDKLDKENDRRSAIDFENRKNSSIKVLKANRVEKNQDSLEKQLWDYLLTHLPLSKYKAIYQSQPNYSDLCGIVKTHISMALLKRDITFSESSLKPDEEVLLGQIGVTYTDLQFDMNVAQKICSPLRSPSALKLRTHLASPHLRLTVSRRGIKELEDHTFGLRQPIFETRQSLLKTREQTHQDIDTYLRVVKMERAREIQLAKESERIAGLTRSEARVQLQSMREGGTERVFSQFIQWLRRQDKSELSRSEINEYFIANMAFLFEEVVVDGIRFFYNPLDIDASLSDSHDRSNPERLLQGLNAIYEAPVTKGSVITKQRVFDWHHIAQEQLPYGSIVVCIPQEIHHNPLLHPFNEDGSQIDRRLFSIVKSEVNKQIAAL